jgi:hypothetical protein
LLRGQQLEQDSLDSKAAANFPVALPHIVNQVLQELVKGLGAVFSSSSSSSSSSNQLQAHASAALLAVVAAHSIVPLADAMEAAGQQLLLESHNAAPAFRIGWATAYSDTKHCTRMQFVRCAQQHEHPTCVHLQQHWQTEVVGAVACLCDALRELGLLQPHQYAETAARQPADDDAAELAGTASGSMATSSVGSSSSCVVHPASCAAAGGSSDSRQCSNASAAACPAGSMAADAGRSSSTGLQPKWSYLLCLQQSSKKWRTATAEYEVSSVDLAGFRLLAGAMEEGSNFAADLERSFKESLQLMRTFAAVAPLPVVCNNPSCENLGGVSEAAAACKVCAGCRCRYCCAACQRADWLRHKRACRRMAAAGATCS